MSKVRVKPLEWEHDDEAACWVAYTPLGEYIAWHNGRVQTGKFGERFVDGGSKGAKAAAQADYEARILSALVTEPTE